jgi:hypothetical protein
MGLFTTKEKVKALPEAFFGQRALTGNLAEAAKPGAFERLSLAGTPYTGELVAPLSEYEQTGLGQLGEYLDWQLPTESNLYKLAESEMTKTLGEEYDPFTSEYYQAYRTNMERELQRAKDRLAATSAAENAYYGGGRLQNERLLEETALGNLAQTLAGLQEAERERRLGAVPTALELTQYGETAPLARIAASQQYGALPRTVEQTRLDAQYQEWLRQLTDLGIPLDTALALATYSPGAVKTGGGLTDMGMLLMGISGGLGSYYGAGGGGGGGTTYNYYGG